MPAKKKYPLETCILLVTLTALLFAFQHLTLVKLAVEPAGGGMISFTTFAHSLLTKISFTPTDIALGFAILVLCEFLLAGEVWFRSLSRFVEQALATERSARILLSLICLVLVRFYFAPGQPTWAGDSGCHITYAIIAAQSFAAGELPIWSNAFSTGSPYIQFYGFLFFYLVGLCDLLSNDPFNAIKLVTGLSHCLSGFAMYLLVRTATGSRASALLAGICYVASFWHTQQVVIMGRLPLSVFYALLPLPFYALERLQRPGSTAKAVIGGAISLGLLAFVHVGYAFWGVFFFFFYAAFRLVGHQANRKQLLGALGIFAGAVAFGAPLTLATWLERGQVGLAEGIHLGGGSLPGWHQLLVWSNAYFRLSPLPPEQHNWLGGYLGLSLVILTLVGFVVYAAQRTRRQPPDAVARAAFACLGLAVLIVFGHDGPILADLAVVQAFNAGRYLLFIVFFLALGCGIAGHLLHQHGPKRTYTFLLLLILADLGPTTFRHLYIPRWAQPIGYPADVLRDLATEAQAYTWPEIPNYRVFATTQQHHFYLLVPYLYGQTSIPQLQSAYVAAPQAWFFSIEPWTLFVQGIWGQAANTPPSRSQNEFMAAGAKLFNVRDILASQAGNPNAIARIKTHADSPVLVAPAIVSYPEKTVEQFAAATKRIFPDADPEILQRVLPIHWLSKAMEIDLRDNTCKRFYIRDHDAKALFQEAPRVEVLEHRVYNQRVSLTLQTSAACYARLAYAHYPDLQVTVNGREVEALQTAGYFIALPLNAGRQQIEITARLSPLRQATLLLDLVLLCCGAAWIWTERRKNV